MPGSRVLLVDQDVEALAQLAAKLRDRGIRVSLANGSQMACERARSGGYDVVLAARSVAEPDDGAMGVIDALSVELAQVPPLLVLHETAAGESFRNDSRVHRDDINRIVLRIEQLTAARDGGRASRASLAPSAHTLENAPLADLLVLLSTERRSGTLTVTTPQGSGELRLVEGESPMPSTCASRARRRSRACSARATARQRSRRARRPSCVGSTRRPARS